MNERPKFKKNKNPGNKFSSMGVELSASLPTYDVPIDLIEPEENNPNDMDDATFNRLVEELDETGFISPIQIVPKAGGKFVIVGGEHRWRGAKTLGKEKVPCNILIDEKFVDDDLRELVMVRLNVIHGKLNPTKFQELYSERVRKYGAEQLQHLFGYTDSDAWKNVTKGVEDALKASGIGGGKKMAEELSKRAGRARSIDSLSSILRNLMKEYGSDLKHSFMVFTYGGRSHVYVIMKDELAKEVDKIKGFCRENDKDMGDVLLKIFLAVNLKEIGG
jgi:hypothetical protein